MLMEWDWLNDQLRHTMNTLYYTPMGMFIRGVPGARAAVDVVHVLGTAMSLGAITLANLRVIGYPRGAPPLAWEAVLPVAKSGLVLMMITGILLVCDAPDRYLFDPTARWQVGFFFGAALNIVLFHTRLFRTRHDVAAEHRVVVRVLAASALAVCLGTIAAGRLAATGSL